MFPETAGLCSVYFSVCASQKRYAYRVVGLIQSAYTMFKGSVLRARLWFNVYWVFVSVRRLIM